MIHPERVSIMTKMAMMETGQNREQLNIARFRASDYMTQQAVFSLLAGTGCFIALGILWAAIRWEQMDTVIDLGHPALTALKFLVIYLVFLAAYMALSMEIYRRRYKAAHAYGEQYLERLTQLEAEMTQKDD